MWKKYTSGWDVIDREGNGYFRDILKWKGWLKTTHKFVKFETLLGTLSSALSEGENAKASLIKLLIVQNWQGLDPVISILGSVNWHVITCSFHGSSYKIAPTLIEWRSLKSSEIFRNSLFLSLVIVRIVRLSLGKSGWTVPNFVIGHSWNRLSSHW